MRKPTSVAEQTPVRVVIVTMDGHTSGVIERVRTNLAVELPGLVLSLHAASDWAESPRALAACRADIAAGDLIFVNMLFMEDHIQAVLPALEARQADCDALVCCMSAAEVVRLTRIGGFKMDGSQKGPLSFLKKLRGTPKKGSVAGEQQMKMLRRLPKILRFIPGTAQDVRAYFLAMQYWLAGSDENLANLVRFLINRYADGERRSLRGSLKVAAPIEYPENGLYHPRLPQRIGTDLDALPAEGTRGTVGLLVMRAYVLSGDTAHYDAVIAGLEARGLRVIPAFASGLDARPAVDQFFLDTTGEVRVDAVVSLTGFSLVGGPAFNDAKAAEELLAKLDVPYLAAHAIEFQTIEQWQTSARGLMPVESTMMVAIPELDGATGPMVFAGRPDVAEGQLAARMVGLPDRIEVLVARVERLIRLRRTPRAERNLSIVLFNFPPNGGATGTAASLSVFASLYNTLRQLKAEGYQVELPASVEALRLAVIEGNAPVHGTDANVHHRISAEDHVRREPWLAEIEAQWGPAPGRSLSDGASILVLGRRFGRIFVGIQPNFGYEGDPMRLLFESNFAPTHAFSAFYRYLREDLESHAVLHFGTHGALEFMPGKQTGMSSQCWPDRLIGDLPHFYLYAANNPSEGAIAKRRSAATLISYLTPPVTEAGLYRGLLELKESTARWRSLPPEDQAERTQLLPLIQAQAEALSLHSAAGPWTDPAVAIAALRQELELYESTLIPAGLHVVGEGMNLEARHDYLRAIGESRGLNFAPSVYRALAAGLEPELAFADGDYDAEALAAATDLARVSSLLAVDHELPALVHALDGGFVRPAPGGDLLHNQAILPTGRNVHGFDPFRIPSAFAVADGARQAQRLLDRHLEDGHALPKSIAMVLWGTDNLKSEGGPLAQALALMGARPRFDSYGRLSGANLIPLAELGRPRIDVVMTLSGIFRDLLPLQTRLLADAAYLAACADEPLEQNFVRQNALDYMKEHGCDLETAALRVFSNADGTYGANVNQLIESGAWTDDSELAEAYSRRKGFAYGRDGRPVARQALLQSAMARVDLAYQNLESVDLGVTTLDHYFDTLGGINRAVKRAKGAEIPVYIGDPNRGEGTVRTLGEQVAIESRTRVLNPKWYEEMLKHGAEGVRHIECHVTNTMGWSATTGQVEPWVYTQISEVFVLDPAMRERLAQLNPKASVKLANRLLEANERKYWQPDPSILEALRRAGEELEDRLEGIGSPVAA
jgi:magnesium chelatase subunit H